MLFDHLDDSSSSSATAAAKDDETSSNDSDSLPAARPLSTLSSSFVLSPFSVVALSSSRSSYLRGTAITSPLSGQKQHKLAEKNDEEGFASIYYTSTTLDDESIRNPPEIAQNCLLIPAAVAFWWYWTRRAARRVWKRSCKAVLLATSDHDRAAANNGSSTINTSNYQLDGSERTVMSFSTTASQPPGFSGKVVGPREEDEFGTWEDVSRGDPSLRFVRWIKGGCAAAGTTSERGKIQISPASRQGMLTKFASAPSLLMRGVSRIRRGDNSSATGMSSVGGEAFATTQPPPIIEAVTSTLEEVEVNAGAAGPTPTEENNDYYPNDYYNYDYYFYSSPPPPRSPLRSINWEYIHGVSESIEMCSDHCSLSPDDVRILSSRDDISITTDEILSRTTVEASAGRNENDEHQRDPDTSSSSACSCFMAAEQHEIT